MFFVMVVYLRALLDCILNSFMLDNLTIFLKST